MADDTPTPPPNPSTIAPRLPPAGGKQDPVSYLNQTATNARAARVRYKFTIPPKLAAEKLTNPKIVYLRELTVDEQLGAMRASLGDKNRMPDELTKACLFIVDGREVNHAMSEADSIWASWSPKVRQLLVQGYIKIHVPGDDDEQLFLESMTQEVG